MKLDLEKVIAYLTGPKGLTLKQIYSKLEIERGNFNSWRSSKNEGRQEGLAQKIIESYPEYFPEGTVPGSDDVEPHNPALQLKLIEVLERENRDLRRQRDKLEQENERLLNELLAKSKT